MFKFENQSKKVVKQESHTQDLYMGLTFFELGRRLFEKARNPGNWVGRKNSNCIGNVTFKCQILCPF